MAKTMPDREEIFITDGIMSVKEASPSLALLTLLCTSLNRDGMNVEL
jgi:hypothetical protein